LAGEYIMNVGRMVIVLFILIGFLLTIPLNLGYAEDQDIVIQTLPEKEFLNLHDMAPGKSESQKITVQNNGRNDFNYSAIFKLNSGSAELFNVLQLKVLKDDKILFDGNMKDFKTLDSRKLNSHTHEELTFTVSVPTEIGNDFQGLSSEVEITFSAQSMLDGVIAGDSILPNTGTNIFNYLLIGIAAIISGWILQIYFLKKRDQQY
jgi:LPXTG-motif cell wall-anchored protein